MGHKRRGRRAFVLLALISLLAVVAGAPVGAANTASESLYDHDNNPATPLVRQFAGADRYATSLSVAQAYVERADATGFVDTLILASGESLVDSASAIGLSATRTAPVVLATPERLSRAVERFITDEFIAEVIILGETEAISQAFEDAVNEIDTISSVSRIGGLHRYSTSAAVAAELDAVGEYCDTSQPAAVLVNVDETLADAVAAGPLAYAMQLPVLLTASTGLSEEVAGYLADAQIERVVIVGGTSVIPEAVAEEVLEAGVLDITRIAGETRFGTAVAVYNALENCQGVTLSDTTIALVNPDFPGDGISAGPLLGEGLGDDGVTPVLFTTADDLPPETSEFLSERPTHDEDGELVDISITVFGGTDVVPDDIVDIAVNDVTTSEQLTATIIASEGSSEITVRFSGRVNFEADTTSDAYRSSALNPSHYTLNSNPLVEGDTVQIFDAPRARVSTADHSVSGATVEINLQDYELSDGDVIEVVDGRISSSGTDRRIVAGASHTIEAVSDNLRPRVNIFAAEGGHEIRIRVTDETLDWEFDPRTVPLQNIRINRQSLAQIVPDDETQPAATQFFHWLPRDSVSATGYDLHDFGFTETGTLRLTICLFGFADPATAPTRNFRDFNDDTVCESDSPSGLETLQAGDIITVLEGTFADKAGNSSRTTVQRVAENSNKPEVIRATVTEPMPTGVLNATYLWFDWDGPDNMLRTDLSLCYELPPSLHLGNCGDVTYLQIEAKTDGVAGGLAGNTWAINWYKLPPDDDLVPDAAVSILERRKLIRIGFDEEATLAAIVNTLLDHDELNDNFEVYSDVLKDPSLGEQLVLDGFNASIGARVFDPENISSRTSGWNERNKPSLTELGNFTNVGSSSVTVTLTYNDVLKSFDYDALRTTAKPAFDQPGIANLPAQNFWQYDRLLPLPGLPGVSGFPTRLVSEISFTLGGFFPSRVTPGIEFDLPVAGETIALPAGIATNFADATSDAVEVRLRAR